MPDPEEQAADREKERKKDLGLLQQELSGARLRVRIHPSCLGVPEARWVTYAIQLCQKGQKHPADSSKDRREQMALKSAQEERKEWPRGSVLTVPSALPVPQEAHLSTAKRVGQPCP